MNLWIKNGHIVDPATGRDEVGDVYVVDGKIADAMTGEYETIDASGKYVMPGFVDLHVHLREPGFEYKETLKTGIYRSMSDAKYQAGDGLPGADPESFGNCRERQSDSCISGRSCDGRTSRRNGNRYRRHGKSRSKSNQ